MLRAVKSAESTNEAMVLIPLWGLCDMYDKWEKPEKSQPCWHRATQIMANQFGQDSPKLAESLKFEANALRKLGRGQRGRSVGREAGEDPEDVGVELRATQARHHNDAKAVSALRRSGARRVCSRSSR